MAQVAVRVDGDLTLFEEVLAGKRAFPLTLAEFESFLRLEHSEENLLFWQRVEEYRAKPSASARKAVVDAFIVPGARHEINISAQERDRILEAPATATTFDSAQLEVKRLMERNNFERFVVEAWSNNLSAAHARWRKKLGVVLLILAVLMSAGMIVMAAYEIGTEVFDSRYWRLLVAPLFIKGCMMYTTGARRICPSLLVLNIRMPEGGASYFRLLVGGRKRRGSFTIKEEVVRSKLRRRAVRAAFDSVLAGVLLSAVVLLAPPGKDLYSF